jgi:hypothetical protein
MPVGIEAPRPPNGYNFEARLIVAVEKLVCQLSIRIFISEFQGLGSEPLRINDRHEAVRQNAFNQGSVL